ncbi:transcription factor [Basidiobolus ranarum]|uniref:Transcription factor n=1 Tax=Basidiobolus ranarum TaxID=34480 RepID=A0ABR2X1J3_9FUNG
MVSTINLQMSSIFMEDFTDNSDTSTCPSPITTSISGYNSDNSEEEPSNNPTEEKSSNEPKLTYATLIAQAIMSTSEQKTLLQDIYSYITTNYEYYRTCSKQWQNSIRHNLSLHKAFCKLPRQKGTPGKGNFWTLTDEYKKFYIDGELHIPKGYELVKEGTKTKSKGKVTKASLRQQVAPYCKPSDGSILPSPPPSTIEHVNLSSISGTPKSNRDLLPTPDSTPNSLCYNLDDTPTHARVKRMCMNESEGFGTHDQQLLFPDLNLYNYEVYQQMYSSTLASATAYQNMLYDTYPEMKVVPIEMGIAPELLMGPNPGFFQTTESFDVECFLKFE